MVNLDRTGLGILSNTWIRRSENDRSRSHSGRHDKCFDVKAADELLGAISPRISFNVSLIPGKPKRRVGNLNHEEVKVGIGRQARRLQKPGGITGRRVEFTLPSDYLFPAP